MRCGNGCRKKIGGRLIHSACNIARTEEARRCSSHLRHAGSEETAPVATAAAAAAAAVIVQLGAPLAELAKDSADCKPDAQRDAAAAAAAATAPAPAAAMSALAASHGLG